jgi:drug/metabolite transporter (DMT)-like permease
LLISAEAVPSPTVLIWGFAAGMSGIIGLGAFYLALARGTMGLIAPLAALIGAALPVVVSYLRGEEIGELRLLGMALAIGAVVLISLPGGEQTADERRQAQVDLADLPLVIVSGLGFAGFYLLIDEAHRAGGDLWWPLTAVRMAGLLAIVVVVGVLLVRSGEASLEARTRRVFGLGGNARATLLALAPLLIASGLGDLGGNAFFVLANQAGQLAVAVVLSSLYPVVTTVLAALLLHERLRPWQLGGIALAALGVVLITGGPYLEEILASVA